MSSSTANNTSKQDDSNATAKRLALLLLLLLAIGAAVAAIVRLFLNKKKSKQNDTDEAAAKSAPDAKKALATDRDVALEMGAHNEENMARSIRSGVIGGAADAYMESLRQPSIKTHSALLKEATIAESTNQHPPLQQPPLPAPPPGLEHLSLPSTSRQTTNAWKSEDFPPLPAVENDKNFAAGVGSQAATNNQSTQSMQNAPQPLPESTLQNIIASSLASEAADLTSNDAADLKVGSKNSSSFDSYFFEQKPPAQISGSLEDALPPHAVTHSTLADVSKSAISTTDTLQLTQSAPNNTLEKENESQSQRIDDAAPKDELHAEKPSSSTGSLNAQEQLRQLSSAEQAAVPHEAILPEDIDFDDMLRQSTHQSTTDSEASSVRVRDVISPDSHISTSVKSGQDASPRLIATAINAVVDTPNGAMTDAANGAEILLIKGLQKRDSSVADIDEMLHMTEEVLQAAAAVTNQIKVDFFSVYVTISWSRSRDTPNTYQFRFEFAEHLLALNPDKTLNLTVQLDAAAAKNDDEAINSFMATLWERSADPSLDMSFMRIFDYALTAGSEARVVLPVCLVRRHFRPNGEYDALLACAAANPNTQIISYAIEGTEGAVYLLFDVVSRASIAAPFERRGLFLLRVATENLCWAWKAIVDANKRSSYADPVCIEQHFRTLARFAYSVVVCPTWEFFVCTTADTNAAHYATLTALAVPIKTIAFSTVDGVQRILVQFLTENPMNAVETHADVPDVGRYAFVSLIAERSPDGTFAFRGVDEHEDTESLLAEVQNACNYFLRHQTAHLPMLTYKVNLDV